MDTAFGEKGKEKVISRYKYFLLSWALSELSFKLLMKPFLFGEVRGEG